jgi:hypothetical protein
MAWAERLWQVIPVSGCVADGGDQSDGVVVVEAGDGVAEADGGAGGEAG